MCTVLNTTDLLSTKNYQNWLISVEDIAAKADTVDSMTEKTQFPGFMFPQVTVERH